jgi:hypothetical protein
MDAAMDEDLLPRGQPPERLEDVLGRFIIMSLSTPAPEVA